MSGIVVMTAVRLGVRRAGRGGGGAEVTLLMTKPVTKLTSSENKLPT